MSKNKLRFPASGASRWMTCLASVYEEAQRPREASVYATEGVAAHAVAEEILKTGTPPKAGSTVRVDKDDVAVSADGLQLAQEYVDYISMVREGAVAPGEPLVELAVHLDPWFGQSQSAIIDYVFYDSGTRTLHVIDLKSGRGVEVYAHKNEQLMLYAGGALEVMSITVDEPIECVKLHIAQPARNHYDAWEMPVDDLTTWLNDFVAPTVTRIKTADPDSLPYVPSESACRFCRAKGDCRALADMALATVSEGFDTVITPMDVLRATPDIDLIDITTLTPGEVFRSLHNVDMIRVWCKAVESQAHKLLESGDAPKDNGFKIVEGKTDRAWTDEEKAENALARAGVSVKDRRKPKAVISVAKAEKIVGKKHRIMTQYVTKPRGAPTVARESDKRPAINIDPLEGFGTEDGGDSE